MMILKKLSIIFPYHQIKHYLWAENKNDINSQALEKVKIFVAQNHYQEAKVVSQQILKNLATTNKTIALVSNDQEFCPNGEVAFKKTRSHC